METGEAMGSARGCVDALRRARERLLRCDGMASLADAVGRVAADLADALDALDARVADAERDAEEWRRVAEAYQAQCRAMRARPTLDGFVRRYREAALEGREFDYDEMATECVLEILALAGRGTEER